MTVGALLSSWDLLGRFGVAVHFAFCCESCQVNRSLPAGPGSESLVFSWDKFEKLGIARQTVRLITVSDIHGTSSSMSLSALVLQAPIRPLPLGQLR